MVKNPSRYETLEEMNKCKEKAIIEINKLYKKLGFVIFEVVEEIKLKGKTQRQRMNYYQSKCRGGCSY